MVSNQPRWVLFLTGGNFWPSDLPRVSFSSWDWGPVRLKDGPMTQAGSRKSRSSRLHASTRSGRRRPIWRARRVQRPGVCRSNSSISRKTASYGLSRECCGAGSDAASSASRARDTDRNQEHPATGVYESEWPLCFQALASRRVSMRMFATRTQACADSMDRSKSLAHLRHLPSHAKVRSTTHRRDRTSKPLARSDRLMISIVKLPIVCKAPRSFGPA
jgi:hypothetical protein